MTFLDLLYFFLMLLDRCVWFFVIGPSFALLVALRFFALLVLKPVDAAKFSQKRPEERQRLRAASQAVNECRDVKIVRAVHAASVNESVLSFASVPVSQAVTSFPFSCLSLS